MEHIKNIKKNGKPVTKGTNLFIDKLYENTSKGETQNGAVTFIRSGSFLLDFFAQAGAMRKEPLKALELFKKAFSEDGEKAVKILFYLRDIRGGQGERDLFRNCLQWLGQEHTEVFENIVGFVSEYGRFDDIFFDNDKCIEIIKQQISKDRESDKPSLLGKWLPTINASSQNTRNKARWFASRLDFNEVEYRKVVRGLRKKISTVEEQMSARKWDSIEYSTVPSQASRIYKDAFKKHDEARYNTFIESAEKGEVKINATTLYPYQIYKDVQSNYSATLEALWNQLPDYTQGKNALVVADVSGSMSGDPMAVSVSLALYFAERNIGQFKDYFLTFSDNPVLQKVVGRTLKEKMNNLERADWGMSTNLQAVFDLILNTAIQNSTPLEEMPETIYIISDMEFNSACDYRTNFEIIKAKYESAGYKKPNLVFWNVNSRGKNLPVQANHSDVAMVSGFSPSVFKMAVENKTPIQVMEDTINSERYAQIKI